MPLLSNMARRLAATGFGASCLREEVDLGALRRRPSPRVYLGLGLIALSCLGSLPALAVLGYHAQARGEPLIFVIGGGAVFVLTHMFFGVGVWLAGGNYAKVALRWATRRFLLRHLPGPGEAP